MYRFSVNFYEKGIGCWYSVNLNVQNYIVYLQFEFIICMFWSLIKFVTDKRKILSRKFDLVLFVRVGQCGVNLIL